MLHFAKTTHTFAFLMTALQNLEARADALMRDIETNPDPRTEELRELEVAIRVLRKYPDAGALNGVYAVKSAEPTTLPLFTARTGSAKEFIVSYLRDNGASSKNAIRMASIAAGREINPTTLTSALSKSDLFATDGKGNWRLVENKISR